MLLALCLVSQIASCPSPSRIVVKDAESSAYSSLPHSLFLYFKIVVIYIINRALYIPTFSAASATFRERKIIIISNAFASIASSRKRKSRRRNQPPNRVSSAFHHLFSQKPLGMPASRDPFHSSCSRNMPMASTSALDQLIKDVHTYADGG